MTVRTYLFELFVWTALALAGAFGMQRTIWLNYSAGGVPRWLRLARLGFLVLAATVLVGGLLLGLGLVVFA